MCIILAASCSILAAPLAPLSPPAYTSEDEALDDGVTDPGLSSEVSEEGETMVAALDVLTKKKLLALQSWPTAGRERSGGLQRMPETQHTPESSSTFVINLKIATRCIPKWSHSCIDIFLH